MDFDHGDSLILGTEKIESESRCVHGIAAFTMPG